jgi:hypothetical protein
MSDELPPERSKASRYPLLSGLLLLSIPGSGSISYLIFGNYAGLNAIALLIVPFAVFCWIFTTIRAIHLAGVRFWFIPSTYVTLIGGIIAIVLCAIMLVVSHESAREEHDVRDATLYVAPAILYSGCVMWSYWYNWRRTNSAILAISITILQILSAAFLIGIFNLWLDGRNTKRYAREHGLGYNRLQDAFSSANRLSARVTNPI